MRLPLHIPYSLILGSKSPRRKDLLAQLGIEFEIRSIEIDETIPKEVSPYNAPKFLAEKKADACKLSSGGELIITADTVVISNGKVLGKPQNKNEAIPMLSELSGNSHNVVTGVCIQNSNEKFVFSETTRVTFFDLTQKDIAYYVDQFRPFDKAGSYGIQEWIGLIGVEKIEGCFFNVIGLPVPRLYQLLKEQFQTSS